MTPARWQQIKEVFDQALEHGPATRIVFLDQVCAGDPDLRREVDSLLDHFETDGPIDELAQGFVTPLVVGLHPEAVEGRGVGNYRVLRQIGQGGMGAVYLAERADGAFEQQVALKLMRRGMRTDELRMRFVHERRILARLTHPNIARLLDGGLTEDGQPYFAMEYVAGEPINRYCDARQLSIEARLRLFATVCRAVQYAHQSLVVHRDLKPSNILVTEGRDGTPQVKLLDFGIAKLLDREEEDTAVPHTRTGMRVMTPEYASPEQVRGEPVTTASDVYALGVILYELLTGRRPYDLQSLSPGEVERVVCETEPARPSTAVSHRDEVTTADGAVRVVTPEEVSHARATLPTRLRRRLAGDLDTMVLKAMQKDAARRYASAEQLLEDVRRYLSGLPVRARPDTLGYRLAKFVRRNRITVTAASALVVLLAGFAVAMTLQQAQTAKERDRSRLEAAKAAQVSTYLIDLFEVADPSETLGDTITAREILEKGAARIEEELADQPEVQATMMDVIGRVYHKLGRYDDARRLLERALEVRRATLGAAHPDVATSMDHLAVVLVEQGAYPEAEPLYREALAMRRKLLPSPNQDLATSLDNLGMYLHERGDLAGARPLYEEALAQRRALFGSADRSVATSLNNLAYLLHEQGDMDEAEPLYREALAIDRAVLSPGHPDIAVDLNNLASLLYDRGDLDAAETLFRESLAIREQVFGDAHPMVATSLNNLASIVHEKGDLDQAEPLYREALALRRKAFKGNHPRVATSLNNVAYVLHEKKQYAEAEAMYREAWAMQRALFGDEHPSVLITMSNVGKVLQDQGRLGAAEDLLREALAKRRAVLGDQHPNVAVSLANLAGVLLEERQAASAEPLFREALAIWTTVDVPWQIAEARSALGACLTDLGRYTEAESLLVDGFMGLQEARGAKDRYTQRATQRLVDFYTAWNKPERATAYRALLEQ